MTAKFYKNTKYNVLTDDGFKHFDGLQSVIVKSVLTIITNVGHIHATPNHEFYYTKTKKKAISKFKIGDILYSINGTVVIEDVIKMKCQMKVYDLVNVAGEHSFVIDDCGIKVQNCVYLDEFAFIENSMEFYTSTYPVISSGKTTKVIITSTPNGMNLFYKLWMDAKNGENNYAGYHVRWDEHPNRDEDFKEETLRNMSEKQWNQEFESVSGDTHINVKCEGSVGYIKIEELYKML